MKRLFSMGRFIFYFCFFYISIVYQELLVNRSGLPIYMLLFSLSLAVIPALIPSFFKKRASGIAAIILEALLTLYFGVQYVYYAFCNSYLSIAQVAMGGDALTRFGKAALIKIVESIWGILALLVPLVILIVLTVKKPSDKGRIKPLPALIVLIFAVLLHFGAVSALSLSGDGIYSPKNVYSDTFILSKSVDSFGILTTLRLEIRGLFFGAKSSDLIEIPKAPVPPEEELEVPEEIVYPYNNLDVDFDALLATEENEENIKLHNYFKSLEGTRQNEYTGMFEGYNLIMICAESFSEYVIDNERTPTLYKMATEGFIFNDYYNTVSDNTSNGEYAILTGLIPDTSLLGRGWDNFYDYNSFTVSKENSLPFCLGNQYKNLRVKAYAFHNYYYNYYGRHQTHTNLGYDFKGMSRGLKKVNDWPTSDVSMMEQTLPFLLTPDETGEIAPFHAYFLTFSGHMPYYFSSNDMAKKNRDFASALPYSESVKAYLAAQQELEYALQYLIDELTRAGVLDNTLIMLTNDHYPYPLGIEGMEEMAGKTLDGHFDKFRSSLILWSSSMTEPIEVDTTCCSLDILPTLSNLLGIKYDSRMLVGKDIFAEGEHIATLADRSFVTDKVFYNCTDGTVTNRTEEKVAEEYISRLESEVKNKFTISEKILYNDYYRSLTLDVSEEQ